MNKALVVVTIFLTSCATRHAGLTLVDHGTSVYRVVVAHNAGAAELSAATELQLHLKEMTGVELPIVPAPADGPAIRLFSSATLGEEEFLIRTSGSDLNITGGVPRGVLYGVYSLLEDDLGVRWLTSYSTHIPKRDRVSLPPLNRRDKPAFAYRDAFFFDYRQVPFVARRRVNGYQTAISAEWGRQFPWANPPHHTMLWLLPEAKYFQEHPDYYMLSPEGKRVPLAYCYANPGTLAAVTAELKAWMRRQPDKRYFSVTQPDWNHHCVCPACSEAIAVAGSPQGAMLPFINRLAENIRDEFPHNKIVTFAYAYTLPPPTNAITPRANVVIQCALLTAPGEARAALERWMKISPTVFVWDYYTGFSHFIVPFPNLYWMAGTIRGFRDLGVEGVLGQGNYASYGGGLNDLQGYLLSKLLWNPDTDARATIAEFIRLHYGPAAKPIQEYTDLIHQGFERISMFATEDDWKSWQAAPRDPAWKDTLAKWWNFTDPTIYLGPARMEKYVALFDEAERLVADQPEYLRRVKLARMQIQTIQIQTLPPGPARDAVIRDYFQTAADWNIIWYGEHKTLAQFRQELGL